MVKDGQGKVIQKNSRKARVCNACNLNLQICETPILWTKQSSWEGEYMSPQANAPIPAFGQADQAVVAHVDRNALYLRLQAKPT